MGVYIMVFVVLAAIANKNINDARDLSTEQVAKQIGSYIIDEIYNAKKAPGCYVKTFSLPTEYNGIVYDILVKEGTGPGKELVITYNFQESIFILKGNFRFPDDEPKINRGDNIIIKVKDWLFFNPCDSIGLKEKYCENVVYSGSIPTGFDCLTILTP